MKGLAVLVAILAVIAVYAGEGEGEGASEVITDAETEAAAELMADVDARSSAENSVEGSGNCMTSAGLNMVKSFEGFRAKAYKDAVGVLTIGYGTVCSSHVLPCPGPVSEQQAAHALGQQIVSKYGPCVSNLKAKLNNNQYSALTSFVYNVGCGSLANVAKSCGLNTAKPNYGCVPGRMKLYNKGTIGGRLVTLPGLVRRRAAEAALFNSNAGSTCMSASAKAPAKQPSKPKPKPTKPAKRPSNGGTRAPSKKPGSKKLKASGPIAPPAQNGNCMTQAGLSMVKSFEGFYSKEYKDVAGIPTIGYGTLCKDNLIKCPGPVSEPVAAAVLGADLVRKYSGCVKSTVKSPLSNNQFSALVSFAYNAGCGAMTNVAKYAKLTQTSGANYNVVPSRMALYNKARVKGVLTVVRGLTRRRSAEGALWSSTTASPCMAPPPLRSAAPIVNAASVGSVAHDNLVSIDGRRPFIQKPKQKIQRNWVNELFNTNRGQVDLPSGTVITFPGIPNATDKRILVKADINDAVKSHGYRAQNRGPVGKWKKKNLKKGDTFQDNLANSGQVADQK